ncbi:MAG: hypothetical protein ACI8RD_014600, partial [Bacillariaceae sp.]
RFSSLLFENESRALGDVNISDFHFFSSNPGCSRDCHAYQLQHSIYVFD